MLAKGLSALGLEVSIDTQQRLLDYLALIEKWNKVYSLTAIRDRNAMVSGHLLDSLVISPHVRPKSVLDVGSGAGLPGIPLAIAQPELQVTVLDSNRKKCAFLRQTVIELALGNVNVVCERVESFRPASGFNTVVTRAFAALPLIVNACLPLVAPGGTLLAMKGVCPEDELATIDTRAIALSIVRLSVPGLAAQRHLVVMTKA